ncbi:MAG: hypothetical protein RQ990_08390 [Candidatus Hydrothermia bacterium]|jgi:hypothetical protein|nr:hypothetical protein [Candidatus Hydrothermia bacterium]
MNNYIYKLYLELLSEKGYLELEEFVKILKEQVNEFFDIVYQNILEGIYNKSQEINISEEEIENKAYEEYQRILNLKKLFFEE